MNFKWLTNFLFDECGQGMTEYALVLILASLIAVGILTLISGSVNDLFGVNTIDQYVTTPAS